MSMTVALVNGYTRIVENIMVVEVGDVPPRNFLFYANPPDWVQIGVNIEDGPPPPPSSREGGKPSAPPGLDTL